LTYIERKTPPGEQLTKSPLDINGELTHGASRDVFKSFRTQLFRVARQRGGNMNF